LIAIFFFSGVGGGLLTPESILSTTPHEDKRLVGSMLVCMAPTIEGARAIIESDIYYTSGVVSSSTCLFGMKKKADDKRSAKWDTERIVLFPFLSAAPLPLVQM
jgi:hypothetical protein